MVVKLYLVTFDVTAEEPIRYFAFVKFGNTTGEYKPFMDFRKECNFGEKNCCNILNEFVTHENS
jgi:hypothetical protein